MHEDFSENQQKFTPGGNPFKVPENYFEELPQRIQERVSMSTRTDTKKTPVVKLLLYSAATAAAIGAVMLVFWITRPPSNEKKLISHESTIDADQITAYLEDEVDENTLIEVCSDRAAIFSPEEIPDISLPAYENETPQNPEPAITFDTSINKNDIIDYLISENIEPETFQ